MLCRHIRLSNDNEGHQSQPSQGQNHLAHCLLSHPQGPCEADTAVITIMLQWRRQELEKLGVLTLDRTIRCRDLTRIVQLMAVSQP